MEVFNMKTPILETKESFSDNKHFENKNLDLNITPP